MSPNNTKAGIGILGIAIIISCIGYSLVHTEERTEKSTHTKRSPTKFITHPLGTAHHVTIQHGDTLANIFHQYGLKPATVEAVTASTLAYDKLSTLHPGQKLTLYIAKHQLRQLIYPYSHDSTLYVDASHAGYKASIKSKPISITLERKTGIVKQSVAQASHDAGMTTSLFHQLHDIFQGTIDFKQVKHGDHFTILYQEYYIDGKKDHPGDIIAVDFVHNGNHTKAIRYTYPKNHTGYYTPSGRGIKPAFLRCPVTHYKRISSYFTYRRLDPYLHVIRPHLGVDYAAPRGTPVRSIGRGIIAFQGKDHGYGNAIIIRFNKKYKALYGHLQKFAAHQKRGDAVKRGQIIGYIGSTGWSTGPHLHFGFYINGIPKNPLKIKLPRGESIPKSYQAAYQAYTKKMLERLTDSQHVEQTQHGTSRTNK
jgi:murein DD-endopeptidase MepM/ murein hydrolase activator NlpD